MRTVALIAAAGVVVLLLATHGSVVVAGESMRPALARGDVVVYRRTSQVAPGEIALYAEEDGHLVVHRVVGIGDRGSLRTKGDANAFGDPRPVPVDRVRGRVVARLAAGSVACRIQHVLCYTSQSVAQQGDDGEAPTRTARPQGGTP